MPDITPLVRLLFWLVPVAGAASVAIAVFALLRWRGGWRIVGLLPVVNLLAMLALTIVSGATAGTTTRILVLALVPASFVNLVFIAGLMLVRRRKARL